MQRTYVKASELKEGMQVVLPADWPDKGMPRLRVTVDSLPIADAAEGFEDMVTGRTCYEDVHLWTDYESNPYIEWGNNPPNNVYELWT